MMFYYWINKGIRPSVFNEMSKGELALINAFYLIEADIKRKNNN